MGIWEVGKTYKFSMKNGDIYTATILEVNELFLKFIDKKGTRRGIAQSEIKDWREVGENDKRDNFKTSSGV